MNVRELALRILNEVQSKQAYANIALARALKQNALESRDRRFLTELVYGTVKSQETLEWMIGRYVNRPLAKIAPVLQNILKLGFYQIFFMDKIPPSAACNQSVELAKKFGHPGMAKFANGVLRSAVRNPEKADFAQVGADTPEYLALRYCHPLWLTKRWTARFGTENAVCLFEFNNQNAALCLRANTLKTTREKLLDTLAAEGAVCRPSDWTPEGIVCSSHMGMRSFQSLQQGLFQVQDESSMLVAHVLGAQPGETIIDTCSAPGGKTTHIAALMHNRGKVLAADIYDHKLETIKENAARLGIDIIEAVLQDGEQIGAKYPEFADRTLVDAPCSGLGVLRRKPDARWRKTKELLLELPRLQLRILKSAAQTVKPGGVLVYSTCTIEKEENEDIVEAFLAQTREFYLEQTSAYLPAKGIKPARAGQADTVQLLPQQDGVDGFFIARMRRRERVDA